MDESRPPQFGLFFDAAPMNLTYQTNCSHCLDSARSKTLNSAQAAIMSRCFQFFQTVNIKLGNNAPRQLVPDSWYASKQIFRGHLSLQPI